MENFIFMCSEDLITGMYFNLFGITSQKKEFTSPIGEV